MFLLIKLKLSLKTVRDKDQNTFIVNKILSIIYPAISDRIKGAKDKLAQTLTKHRRMLLPSSIPTGATVMIKDPVRENKFEPKYIGPYIIARRAYNGACVLRDVDGDILDRHVPIDQIKIVSKTSSDKIKIHLRLIKY